MNEQPLVRYASRTDVGMRRSTNQDALVVRLCEDAEQWHRFGHLFVVADGMGGHSVGDLASRITAETLPGAFYSSEATLTEDQIRSAVLAANRAVHERGRQYPEYSDMGTTCSALVLAPRGAVIGHVGDSRIYLVRDAKISQLTFDHSLQWEMIRLGRATAATVDLFHPRNVITRCIGPDPNVEIDIEGPFSMMAGDRLVLCSDGLSNHLSDSEIGQIASSVPPLEAAQLLINLANCRGGSDNTTVIVLEVQQFPSDQQDHPPDTLPPEPATEVSEITQVEIPAPGIPAWVTAAGWVCLAAGVAGTAALLSEFPEAGLILLVVAAISGLLRLWHTWQKPPVPPAETLAEPGSKTLAEADQNGFTLQVPVADDFADSQNPARHSPYKAASAALTVELLDDLAEIQSELVEAARDSAWTVDFDQLTALSRDSVAAQQSGSPARAMQTRGQAIELLMQELYRRSRGENPA